MRFLLYSHDGLGLGHTCRNLSIARALTELAPRAAVLLATGSDDVTRLGVPHGVDILKLPGISKIANDHYRSRHLAVSEAEVRQLRSRLLTSTVQVFRPSVMLVDKHPFGAGGELKEALAEQRRSQRRTVLGLRDILDDPGIVQREWAPYGLPQAIPNHYDCVLVYGQKGLFDAALEYGFPPQLAERTRYCGYVVNTGHSEPGNGNGHTLLPKIDPLHPLVIATVGGGEDGFRLLHSFLPACGGEPWRTIAVSGPMMPQAEHAQLENLAPDYGVELHSFVPGLNRWLAAADAVLCMGGYNTLTQALAAGSRIICVPRVAPRQEQLVRSEAFARRGLLRLVKPGELSPARLRSEIHAALATPRAALQQRIHENVQFEGAELAAHQLLAFARKSETSDKSSARSFSV